jgi:hypothetical protein
MHNNPGIRRARKMPTPPKSDPLLMFRVEQLEEDHVSSIEFKALVDEVREFKRALLSTLKWIIGLLATGIITLIVGIAIAWFTRSF